MSYRKSGIYSFLRYLIIGAVKSSEKSSEKGSEKSSEKKFGENGKN